MTPEGSIVIDRALRAARDALAQATLLDAQRLKRRLHSVEHGHARGTLSGQRLEKELGELARSAEEALRRVEARRVSVPASIAYPPELPVCQLREQLARAIATHQVVVVCGETGSGKTTQLPKICLDIGRGVRGLIGHTQPRRIAARTVARRIADELGSPLGELVGFKVRFGDQTSPRNLIKLMTDGILLAETQGDRALLAYDTIIIDEAHERSLNIDFMLGYLRTLLPRRPDLKVIVTSATIDPERFAQHFAGLEGPGPAPIVHVSGRTYPVDVRYRPPAEEGLDERDEQFQAHVLSAVDELCAHGPGDILVFLSGEREIRETAETLERHRPPSEAHPPRVLPLFARLTAEEQQRVFEGHRPGERRIVLATNVAETSLTVPGIRFVIDPGVARISRYSPRTKVQRLEIEAVSRASADQRAGRCGRLGPGVCVRLYSQEDYAARPQFTDPEVVRDNLASVILQMAALNLGTVEEFPFVEPPDRRNVRDGYETLHELGAIDDEQRLTPIGRDLARLPIDPRIGRMILAAGKEGALAEVLVIAAALSIQDPRERPLAMQDLADQAHAQFDDASSDFLGDLRLWRAWQERKRHLSGSKLRRWCKENYLSFVRMREWEDIHGQLSQLASELHLRPARGEANATAIHRALLTGLLCNIGTKATTDRELGAYMGGRGNRFNIFPGSALFQKGPTWLMAAEIVRTTKVYARGVAPIEPAWVEELGAHLLKRTYSEPRWDRHSGRVVASERVTIFGLELVPKRRVHFGAVDPPAAREIFIHHALVLGDMDSRADFLAHNLGLEDQVRQWEVRTRRNNLVSDVERRFQFYAGKVPKEVVTAGAFERWRHDAIKANPRLLHMSVQDVVAGDGPMPSEADFPDELDLGALKLPLRYRLEPGHDEDGVTLVVPVEALGQVPVERLGWLVPGHVAEKVETILKGVGKEYRRLLPPAGQVAAQVAPLLSQPKGPFLDALREAVRKATGVEVPRDVLGAVPLPAWMTMRVEVRDAEDKVLAAGRDLNQIRAVLAPRLRTGLLTSAGRFHRDGITTWDFGDLPERVELERGGVRLAAFPGIVDQGPGSGTRGAPAGSVGLRLFDTFEAAQAATGPGSRRLFLLAAGEAVRRHATNIPGLEQAALAFAPLGGGISFRDQLAQLLADRAFLGEMLPVRTEKEFAFRTTRGIERLPAAVQEVAPVVVQTMQQYQELSRELARARPAGFAELLNDLRDQLGVLMPREFLAQTPFAWLRHYPRYVQAMRVRLQRASSGGLEKDARAMAEVTPFVRALADLRSNQQALGLSPSAIEEFGWHIQELRVQLFAQELRTALPVSSKRLQEMWTKIVKG